MNVTVLYGGPSAEREVSLRSGSAVIEALRAAGHEVYPSDVSPEDLSFLRRPADVVFPVLHGAFGESGELQEILEAKKIPFVGSGSAASRLGMNKVNTKIAWERAGLPTPRWLFLQAGQSFENVFAPSVVKAVDSGSSIDVHICRTLSDARQAVDKILSAHGKALIEQFIEGPELTVGILEERPLPPINIVAASGHYDNEAKYARNDTQYRFDHGLPSDLIERVMAMALKAHQIVGCRDLSRTDVMIDQDQRPYLLEINTLPGFTSRSLLPKAAQQAGISFTELVDRLVKRAYARGPG